MPAKYKLVDGHALIRMAMAGTASFLSATSMALKIMRATTGTLNSELKPNQMLPMTRTSFKAMLF